jgi:hypothetical protein
MIRAGGPTPLGHPGEVGRWVRAALLAVAALLAGSGRVAAAEAREATVLMLAGNGLSAADRRLIEALRIYTSDVGCRLVLSAETPPDADSGSLSRIERLARTENADIVVWTSRRSGGGLAFYLLTVSDRDVRATDIAALGTNRAADSVALKIRSLLSSSASPSSSAAPPPLAAPASSAASAPPAALAPAAGAGGAGARAPAPVGARSSGAGPANDARPRQSEPAEPAGPDTPSAPAAPPEATTAGPDRPRPVEAAISTTRVPGGEPSVPETPWVTLRVGYDVAAPIDETWVSQGLMLSAEARLGATELVAHLDGVLTRTSAVNGGEVTGHIRDTPFGLAIARRWSGPRLSLAVGPRAGLHVIDVGAAAGTDVSGGSRQFSGGLGLWSSVDLTLVGPFSLWLGASAEVLLPGRRFTLAGTAVAHTSPALLAAAAGLQIAIP